MDQDKPSLKIRFLRFIWGFFPWVVVVSLIVLVVIVLGKIKNEKARLDKANKSAINMEVPSVRVITLNVEPKKLEDKLNLPATVESYENLWVKTEVSGQVTDIVVKEGQFIEKGRFS